MELTGTVMKSPVRTTSPSGIEHCRFWLEHRSVVVEADLSRQAYCRIPVVVSGPRSQALTQNLVQGCSIQVRGFITSQADKNGIGRLVLHAEDITHI
jgi:primosomal replication protein N